MKDEMKEYFKSLEKRLVPVPEEYMVKKAIVRTYPKKRKYYNYPYCYDNYLPY